MNTNREDDYDEDATARAVAAIQQQLEGFSSPMMTMAGGSSRSLSRKEEEATPSSSAYYYEMDDVQWMQHELRGSGTGDGNNNNNNERYSTKTGKTPKRTPLMERAGTPVMSNSSSSKNLEALASTLSGSQKRTPAKTKPRSGNYGLDYSEPLPVQTPLQRKFKTATTPLTNSGTKRGGSGGGGTSSATSATTAITLASLKQSVFRRHHDALLEYLLAKRSLHTRMELERRERELDQAAAAGRNRNSNAVVPMDMDMDMDTTMDTCATSSVSLSKQESKAEVDFCKSLCQIGYGLSSIEDRSSSDHHPEGPTEEGHFWSLLATLRKLNLSALIWDDDPTSMTQNASTQAFFLQQLTSNPRATPKDLVEALLPADNDNGNGNNNYYESSRLPLVLQRKRELLGWIQSCLELESKDTKARGMGTRTIASASHPDDAAIPSLVSEMDASILKTMMQVCLALVLEGKTTEALEVARSRGQSWRAAAWMGGEPAGYKAVLQDDTKTVEKVPVGNPNRFLWKRQVWKTGRKLLLKQQSLKNQPRADAGLEEAAIYSVLADDVQNALQNPCIRSSWTRSLCVLLKGIHGRTQDEVLHRHNTHRRRSGGCFPGHQYEQQENEQLMHSSQLASMAEAHMVSLLQNNPFLRQQDERQQRKLPHHHRFSYKSAILAFVVGKSAILELCDRETSRMVSKLRELAETTNDNVMAADGEDDDYVNQDWEGVRFLTHVTLFLDSLQDSSTPVVCDGITEKKNAILMEYVQYLESRPDLWHMITLYVSLLPEDRALEYFPTVLARVLDDSERKTMIWQIQELMPSLELPLLQKVVRLSLSAPATATAASADDMDAIKSSSLRWLLHKGEFAGDALVCANILLREFFLDEEEDKTHAAEVFLKEYLPGDLLETVRYYAEHEDPESSSDDSMEKVSNAITEHLAFMSYLDAYEAFGSWKETLRATPTALEDHHRIPNYDNLSEMEKSIADANFLRTWVKEKKKHLERTLTVAEEARKAWHNVLTHPGGWLLLDDEEERVSNSRSTSTPAIVRVVDLEEQKRRTDIQKIRSRHLVLAASLYHQVCEETASWLSRSLNETSTFHLSREEVLQRLQSGSGSGFTGSADSSSQQQMHTTPGYWYQHALDLATLVASDQHGIYKAFPRADLQELITKIGETAVSKLMNE
eukprot:jgi/Psemu1/328864/estExt_fgenesh1_pg.C_26840002